MRIKREVKILNRICLQLLLAMILVTPALAKTVTVGGTGSSTPLVHAFAAAYKKIEPGVEIQVIDPPMGSSGSVRAILAGAIDLAFSGKPLTEDQKGQGGKYWELGRTPFILVTTKKPAPHFTLEDLVSIYKGDRTTWKDGSQIRLVIRDRHESDTRILRRMSSRMDEAIDRVLERPGMLIAANDLENLSVLSKTPGSLGTSNFALVKALDYDLHVCSLNGTMPSIEALENNEYPYYKELYIAHGLELSPVANGFLQFILSREGNAVTSGLGYLSSRPW